MVPDPVNKPPERLLSRLFKDRFFLLALLAGPLVWVVMRQFELSPPEQQGTTEKLKLIVMAVLIYPVLEERVFRGAVQSSLLRFSIAKERAAGVTGANLVTSALFSVLHLLTHTPLWAMLVFVPSLIFGELRDRYQSTLPSILLHSFYNLCFYLAW